MKDAATFRYEDFERFCHGQFDKGQRSFMGMIDVYAALHPEHERALAMDVQSAPQRYIALNRQLSERTPTVRATMIASEAVRDHHRDDPAPSWVDRFDSERTLAKKDRDLF